jgi:hypothetical protein
MPVNSIASGAAAALPLVGLALALVNWNAQPDARWAWAAVIVMCLIMMAVRRRSRLAVRQSPDSATLARRFASVNGAVVFGSLMMIVPLLVTLAHAYGLVDDPDSGRRATMIIFGAYLAMTGNAIPRMLPPVESMQCDASRLQAFQRLTGWTWALCGLAFTAGWLALPIGTAEPVSTVVVLVAMTVTIVRLIHLRRLRTAAS